MELAQPPPVDGVDAAAHGSSLTTSPVGAENPPVAAPRWVRVTFAVA